MKHEHEHREHEHHERHHRETGGRNDAAEDLDRKTTMRVNAPEIDREANEKKRGGRAKRKDGGGVKRHMVDHEGKLLKAKKDHEKRPERKRGGRMPEHAKHVEMHGEHEKHRADRKPRKDGGRTGADEHPFSSARKGETPPGRKEMAGYE